MKRIWLDTVTLQQMQNPIETLQEILRSNEYRDCKFVIANTILDVKAFQENLMFVQQSLLTGVLSIEIWSMPDQMTEKPFFWSSAGVETPAAKSFEEAIKNLPNKEGIMRLKDLMEMYGIRKEDWPKGQWAPPAPLGEEAQKVLGLTEAATRTEVLKACKKANRMDLFDSYNVGYNRGLARQHTCDAILNTDGSVTKI